jgi:hypothetical protein
MTRAVAIALYGPGNHVDKILALYERLVPEAGVIYTVEIRHAPWCRLLTQTLPCDCDPDVQAPERLG